MVHEPFRLRAPISKSVRPQAEYGRPGGSRLPHLSQTLVEHDASGDRHVERAHLPGHRHRHDVIAGFFDQRPHPAAFATQHERRLPAQIQLTAKPRLVR